MQETKKFTAEEMESIRVVQQKYQEKLIQFGQVNINRISIENAIKELNLAENKLREEFVLLQSEEQSLISDLSAKYGDGHLNVKDGSFTPTT